jgi:alpha-methylacyl-CoA racemase
VNMLDGGMPWYDVYETADGKHMAVGSIEPKFYAEFVRLLGVDSDESQRADADARPLLREQIGKAFAGRTRAEWTEVFEGTDACVAPVLGLTEAPHHPHNVARGTFIEVDGVTQPAPAPRFSRTAATVRRGPVEPGTDTRDALTDWGVQDVDSLLASGAAGQAGDS